MIPGCHNMVASCHQVATYPSMSIPSSTTRSHHVKAIGQLASARPKQEKTSNSIHIRNQEKLATPPKMPPCPNHLPCDKNMSRLGREVSKIPSSRHNEDPSDHIPTKATSTPFELTENGERSRHPPPTPRRSCYLCQNLIRYSLIDRM